MCMYNDGTMCSGFKFNEGRFRLDKRNKFSMIRMVRHWERLLKEAVDVSSLEMFKVRWDRA